jgi:hypothetical protein
MAKLTPSEAATLLEQARAARHQLLTGKKKVSLRYEGTTVEFRNFAEDTSRLELYIRELEVIAGDAKPRRPFEVIW